MKNISDIRLSDDVIPERYKIKITPDLKNFTFRGEEEIEINFFQDVDHIKLHAIELEILSAEVIQKDSKLSAKKISYQKKDETVVFNFPGIKKGKVKLKLQFKGFINDKLKGFYKSNYQHNGKQKYLATTQFEATDARRAFPCFDEPDKKAVFDVTLVVPNELIAISNTIESVVQEHEGGYKVVTFEPTPKMSTYLLAFIIGEFDWVESKTKSGVLVRVFTTPGKKHQGEFALDVAVKCLEFFEEYFAIPYPLPVMDLIAIPDFTSGAMENWGAVTYRETAILVDPKHTATANRQWVALVIAHELAHQWFGNLVTMNWWTQLWLNEGFASYIEYLAVDKIFPEWNIWSQFVVNDLNDALELDGLENTHPIEVEVKHPAEISEIFDAVSYSKGASVIRMIAEYLGEEDFRKGLQHYLKKFSYSNAVTEDLWDSLEEISKKPVRKIMNNWVKNPGYPLLTLKENAKKIKITQQRFSSSNSKLKSNSRWTVPVTLNKAGKMERFLLDKSESEILKPPDTDWIKVNTNETGFYRVNYPEKYLDLLKKPIEEKELSDSDRLGIIRDVFDISWPGYMPTWQALKIVTSYEDEKNYSVWADIARNLGKLDDLISDESFYDSFTSFAARVFIRNIDYVGWQKDTKEEHNKTLLRSLILGQSVKYGNIQVIETAKTIFNKSLSGKQEIEPDLRMVVYRAVAETGGALEYEQLLRMYDETQLQEEKNRLAIALCLFKEKPLLEKTLSLAFSDRVRSQDAFRVVSFVWGNPKGKDLAWEFVKENWDLILKRYSSGHMMPRYIKPAEVFNTKEKALDVKNFFKSHPAPGARRAIQQTIEQILTNAAWLKREGKGIENFLSLTD